MSTNISMIQIITAPDEVSAAIIKGFLESRGIQASYSNNISPKARVWSTTIYCMSDRAEEALKLLNEQGLIGK